MEPLSIGFSPCPNDTYIFCGLVKGHIPLSGFSFQHELLADVETLNEWAIEGRLDITKLSYHAYGHVLDKYVLLNSGSALGRGCGPLLVTAQKSSTLNTRKMTVGIPGKYTTAAMLLKLYEPDWKHIVTMRFDEIMPAIHSGEIDCGVIIHESRFTYQNLGLSQIADLGSWWEEMSGLPLPLGGIAVKRTLGPELIEKIDKAIRESIIWAKTNEDSWAGYVKEHAQELDDSVIKSHIDLYVNPFSEDLGKEGREAIEFFLEKGRQTGIFPDFGYDPFSISES